MSDDPAAWGAKPIEDEGPAAWGAKPASAPEFSWSRAITDIPSEIGKAAGSALSDIGNLSHRSEQGSLEGLMTTGKAALAVPQLLASPITGTARSLVGHTMANLEHKAGEYINPAVAAKDNPEQMYETAKGDVDTAMSAARPAGSPIKVGGAYEWQAPPAGAAGSNLKPVGVVKQPETEAFFDAADNHYANMRGYGVEIDPAAMNRVADNVMTELHAEGYRPRNAPKVFDAIEELRNPAGQNHEISDIDSVRKVLGKARLDHTERDAARRAIGHIDDYLANLHQNPQDVLVNPHFAGRVAEEAVAARSNYAVAKRAEDIDEALDQAERQAARSGSGGNINNAIRQRLSALRNNKKKMTGWTDEEKAELDAVINGGKAGNAARQAGKFAPHGIVSTVMAAGAGHAILPGIGEVAVPAAGLVAKLLGDRLTRMGAERLSNVVKARSPLGKQTSTNAAAQSALLPQAQRPRLLPAAVRAGLPATGNIPLRQIQSVVGSAAEDQDKGPWRGDNEPNQGEGQKSHGGPVERARGGAVHNHSPTEAQKEAGNYAKTHRYFHGLDITIENLKGRSRSGIGRDGKRWSVRMPADYGYIKQTVGADKDHVDVYLGPNKESDQVFVVDQKDAETGRFDEHKVLLAFSSEAEARKTYRAGFSDGKDRIKHMRRMTVAEFKDWLKRGNTSKPIKAQDAGLRLAFHIRNASGLT